MPTVRSIKPNPKLSPMHPSSGGSSDASNLDANEKWLKLALDSAAMCAYSWDLRTNVIKRSSTSETFKKADPLRDSWSFLESIQNLHAEDRLDVIRAVQHAIEAKTQFQVEFRVQLADGLRWFQSRGQALYDNRDHAYEVLSVVSDITATKENELRLLRQAEELELAKHQLRLALDSAGMVAIAGLRVGDDLQSPEMCRLLGVEDESTCFTPENILEQVHPEDRNEMAERISSAREFGTPSHHEFRFRGSSGNYRWFCSKGAHRIESNESFRKAYLIIQDITDRKEAEEALRRKSLELAAINEKLNRFSSVVAHDLKGPLSTMAMAADLLSDAQTVEEANASAQFIKRGVTRMTELVDDLLQFARLGSVTGLPKEEVSFQALFEILESNLQAAFRQSGARMVVATPLPTVVGYPTQLLQLLQNLVSNALKFRSQAQPEIRIAAADRGEMWEIALTDNGVGIAAVDLKRIFEPFERAQSAAVEGVGLGLSICKRMVELHGGEIWAQSEVGSGTTFYFTLAKS